MSLSLLGTKGVNKLERIVNQTEFWQLTKQVFHCGGYLWQNLHLFSYYDTRGQGRPQILPQFLNKQKYGYYCCRNLNLMLKIRQNWGFGESPNRYEIWTSNLLNLELQTQKKIIRDIKKMPDIILSFFYSFVHHCGKWEAKCVWHMTDE
jgi:hypothetical protein